MKEIMAEDFDIDDLLEAPYKKPEEKTEKEENGDASEPEEEVKKKKKKRSRSRSRKRSSSPKGKRKSRSKSRDRKKSRSKSRDKKKSRSRSRERRRRSRSRSRDRRRRRSPRRKSPSPIRRRRSRSPRKSPMRSPRKSPRRRSGSRSRGDREIIHRSKDGVTTISLLSDRERRWDEENVSQEERDSRTVFIMQLAKNVTIRDIQDFFSKVGQVRDVRLISDRNSRRSKGIGYVEFTESSAVTLAIKLSGQKLLGVPIMVSPTMAEKNRYAAAQAALVKPQGPLKLYVGSLHYNITEPMLKAIFEPFGTIDSVALQYDPDTNVSKGFGFVTFKEAGAAKRAMEQMNNFELAGRPMRVNTVSERTDGSMSYLDDEETEKGGIEMNSQSRASLMQKLAQTHGSGMQIPTAPVMPAILNPTAGLTATSTCLILSNLFDPRKETEPEWDLDIRNDVLEEVAKLGIVVHLSVDKVNAEGNVYIKTLTPDTAVKIIQTFNGRWFAGRTIRAATLPLPNYHTMFPDAQTAQRSLKPEPR